MTQPSPKFHGKSVNGSIQYHGYDAKRREAWLRHMEGKEVEEVLRKPEKDRSNQQNRYYWGIVVKMLAESAGYEPEEMHDALREKFLRVHEDGPLPSVRSTAKLTTAEFEEYMSQCRRLGAEMYGLYVPEPNEAEGLWKV